MARSAVLLIQDGNIACIERRRSNRSYYVFPGGTIESGETAEQAAIREAKEELGVDLALGSLAAVVLFGNSHQSYFWASIIGGKFGSGWGAELASPLESQRGSYLPVWLPIIALNEYNVRPPMLAQALADGTLTPSGDVLTISEELPRE